jgi:uncharacterized phage-associated protein
VTSTDRLFVEGADRERWPPTQRAVATLAGLQSKVCSKLTLACFPPSLRSSAPYAVAMATSAQTVAAALRERLPGLPSKKLHKLLYYCQGHHLAVFGQPLFTETISAWDMGPVVGQLWYAEHQGAPVHTTGNPLSEAGLNTVGYVVSRYGALTGQDLEHLTHAERPWQRANEHRPAGQSARIEPAWIEAYFRTAGDDDEAITLDAGQVRDWLDGAETRRATEATPDSAQALRARLSRSA